MTEHHVTGDKISTLKSALDDLQLAPAAEHAAGAAGAVEPGYRTGFGACSPVCNVSNYVD